MVSFNAQRLGIDEGRSEPIYRIQLETTNEKCYETVQEIIRLYLDRERADRERAEQMKQYSALPYKSYEITDAKMPELSGCGVIMTNEGAKQTK